MIAEIVTIGTELLLGEIVDGNAAYIATQLAATGVDHYYTTTVGDNEERIAGVLRNAIARSDVVITTGGLGPTIDDVTRQAVANATDRELVLDPDSLAQIEAFFVRRGYAFGPTNRRQAYFPRDAIVIDNPVGTAPGFLVDIADKDVISVPGVPHEMRHLLHRWVLPYLSGKLGERAVILSRMVHTAGIGESTVGQAISDLMEGENPTVGTRAHPGQVDVCITAKAATHEKALELVEAAEGQLREKLESGVYGVDETTLADVVVTGLRRKRMTLALGETNTGGLVARQLLAVHGGGDVLAGVRIALDGVALAEETAVPAEGLDVDTARAVAASLRDQCGADLALAVLEGSGEESPTYMALAAPDGVRLNQWPSYSDRGYAVRRTIPVALNMVRSWLSSA